MHLIVIIAIGVFGGLWLFVKWGEWREARWERRELKRQARAEREEIARIQAMMAPPHEAFAELKHDREPIVMAVYAIGVMAAIPVGYLILGGHF